MPAAAILGVEQCQALIPGMGDNDRKPLAGARRCRGVGFWHLLCRGAGHGGFRQARRDGRDPLARRRYVIVGRVSWLDLAPQFQAPMPGFVPAPRLAPTSHPPRYPPTTPTQSSP